jgi:hypothetical protein
MVNILHCTIHFVAVFQKRFQDHRRISEQLLDFRVRCLSESRNKLLEEGHWKDLHNKILQTDESPVDFGGSLIHAFVF